MSNPYLGEVKIIAFTYAPKGWAFCNGQTMQIAQNQALFAILGTTYGGNGITTFNLPNLQGRVPLHMGQGFPLGLTGGETAVTLNQQTMASHTHQAVGTSNGGSTNDPTNGFWANGGYTNYAPNANTSMDPAAITTVGGGQPHDNMSPYLVLNFIIALVGVFPPRN
jgi:microcystin-dependent protein